MLGTRLPGPGAVYISQTLNFRAPVKIGDTVVVTVTVAELIGEIARATVMPLRGRRGSGAGWRGAGEGSKRARQGKAAGDEAIAAVRATCVQVLAVLMDITTPPSARTGEPVIALASREHRNATTSATSSGLASRLNAIRKNAIGIVFSWRWNLRG